MIPLHRATSETLFFAVPVPPSQHGSKRRCSGTIKRGVCDWDFCECEGGKLATVAVPISEHNSTALLPLPARLLAVCVRRTCLQWERERSSMAWQQPPLALVLWSLNSNGCRSRGRVVPRCYYTPAATAAWYNFLPPLFPSILPSGGGGAAGSQVLVLSPSISFTIKIPPPSHSLLCAWGHAHMTFEINWHSSGSLVIVPQLLPQCEMAAKLNCTKITQHL